MIKNKDQKEHIGNLYLTNSNLKNLGLKSLTDIFKKHALKKRLIFKKLAKNRRKTDKFTGDIIKLKLEKIEFQCGQKLILNQLKELISLTKNLNKRLAMLERKLDKKTIKKSRKIL